jgi:surface protein
MSIAITNKNIKTLVNKYIKQIPNTTVPANINDWDVSDVTDMSNLFSGKETFNQPLDKWNVSGVTNMEAMFSQCDLFNQPLDSWDVSRVTNMKAMFFWCKNFNQPLNSWTESILNNATNTTMMFQDCVSMLAENKPVLRVPVPVNAYQVHQAFAKIDTAKLNSFLKEKSTGIQLPIVRSYSSYIKTTMLQLIGDCDVSEEQKTTFRANLNEIMTQRIDGLNFENQSSVIKETIINTLEYVKLQSPEFKNMYIESFNKDCVNAHEGENSMSCAGGVLDRIVLSLTPACIAFISNNEASENKIEEYQILVGIIDKNPKILIREYIFDWYKIHNIETPGKFPDGTEPGVKRENLKSFLLEKFPQETSLIEEQITTYADNIGYDNAYFTYRGGKQIKSKKTRKSKTRKSKTRKSKTRKSKTRKSKTRKSKTRKSRKFN